MANIVNGEGTILQYSSNGSTYVTVANRVSISGPKMEVASVETTNLDSTSRSFRPAVIPDQGSIDCEFYYDPDDVTHAGIRALMATPSIKKWKLTFTDGTPQTGSFDAFVTSFEISGMELDSNLTASMSLKVTGLITWA